MPQNRTLFLLKYQTGQVLIFSDGKQKPGGQPEEKCRQKRRPNQDLFVPGNHLLPDAFFLEECIDQEDGELTDLKVFYYQTVLMRSSSVLPHESKMSKGNFMVNLVTL